MRSALFVVMALAACAPQMDDSARATLAYINQPEVKARLDAAAVRERATYEASRPAGEREAEIRERQALTICSERGNMAATQPAYGGPGMSGAIAAGLQLGLAGSSAEASCWRAYQATGIMPSY